MFTCIPSRSSDAGPEDQPMDLGDWLFEFAYAAEEANRSHTKDEPRKILMANLDNAESALRRVRSLL